MSGPERALRAKGPQEPPAATRRGGREVEACTDDGAGGPVAREVPGRRKARKVGKTTVAKVSQNDAGSATDGASRTGSAADGTARRKAASRASPNPVREARSTRDGVTRPGRGAKPSRKGRPSGEDNAVRRGKAPPKGRVAAVDGARREGGGAGKSAALREGQAGRKGRASRKDGVAQESRRPREAGAALGKGAARGKGAAGKATVRKRPVVPKSGAPQGNGSTPVARESEVVPEPGSALTGRDRRGIVHEDGGSRGGPRQRGAGPRSGGAVGGRRRRRSLGEGYAWRSMIASAQAHDRAAVLLEVMADAHPEEAEAHLQSAARHRRWADNDRGLADEYAPDGPVF